MGNELLIYRIVNENRCRVNTQSTYCTVYTFHTMYVIGMYEYTVLLNINYRRVLTIFRIGATGHWGGEALQKVFSKP